MPLYAHPQAYSTADILDHALFELHQSPYSPKFQLLELFKGTRHLATVKDIWSTFHNVMAHPIDVAQPRDLVAVYLKGVDNYNNYNPGRS